MGCGSSSHRLIGFGSRANRTRTRSVTTPDPNPNPVNLCRDRTDLIRAACDRRYAAAGAHVAYLRSVSALGDALVQFAVNELSTSAPGSPVLTLPPSSKARSSKAGSESETSTVSPLSHALSFGEEEETAEEDKVIKLSSSTVTAPLTREISAEEEKPKRTEEEKPSPESSASKKFPEASRSSPLRSNKNMATATATASAAVMSSPSPARNYHPYNYGYEYGYGYGDGYGYGFGYGEAMNLNAAFDDGAGTSNQTMSPPPMPVQESSRWEFFDPFINSDRFMESYRYMNSNFGSGSEGSGLSSYLNSPDLNRVRMREGIPDLEDEVVVEEKQKEIEIEKEKEKEKEKQNEIEIEIEIEIEEEMEKEIEGQKEGKGKEKVIDEAGTSNGVHPTVSVTIETDRSVGTEEEGSGGKNKDVRFEDEKVARASTPHNGPEVLVAVEMKDLDDVMKEIKEQFDCVAECAEEVSDVLEVDKVRHRSGALGSISSRFLDPALPILPNSCLPHKNLARGKTGRRASANSTANGDINGLTPQSLSMTLDKLYVWEKRLYKEVKDEEKLRAEYERKYRRLKYLDDQGADYNVIKSANEAIKNLHNQINIVMKSADTISSRIHHIRDEELQPQLIQIVQSLIKMWKSIFDCHKKQLRAIKYLNTHNIKPRIGSDPKAVARSTLRLEKEISKWHRRLKDWIETQRSFIEALNGYLILWIRNEPYPVEETADGVPPFSPARIGAPSSFVISNDWYQGVKKVSEAKTLEGIANFQIQARQYRKLQEDENRYSRKAKHLSMIYRRRLESFQDETGLVFGNLEIVSLNGKENVEGTETSIHIHDHDHRVAQLRAIKTRRDEERAKQMEALGKLNEMGSVILKTGLEPVFQELDNFLSEYLKAYEAVRVPVKSKASN